jgi:hypothetical protein
MHTKARPATTGPRALAKSLTEFARATAGSADLESRGDCARIRSIADLGLAAATSGRIGVKHIRALKPWPGPTGWHWHDMTAHYVYVLRGWLTFASRA